MGAKSYAFEEKKAINYVTSHYERKNKSETVYNIFENINNLKLHKFYIILKFPK